MHDTIVCLILYPQLRHGQVCHVFILYVCMDAFHVFMIACMLFNVCEVLICICLNECPSRGLDQHACDHRPCMAKAITFIQTCGDKDLEKMVNEIHHDTDHLHDAPVRHALPLPDIDFGKSYRLGKIVLEQSQILDYR